MTVDEWQNELVEKVRPALEDMAEIEDVKVEGETAVFASKLFLAVTDNDPKQAEGIGAVIESYMSQMDKVLYRE